MVQYQNLNTMVLIGVHVYATCKVVFLLVICLEPTTLIGPVSFTRIPDKNSRCQGFGDMMSCPLAFANLMFLAKHPGIPATRKVPNDLWEFRNSTLFAFWWSSWMLKSKGASTNSTMSEFLEFQKRNRKVAIVSTFHCAKGSYHATCKVSQPVYAKVEHQNEFMDCSK